MPLCPYCHTIVSEDTRFCPECGRPLAVTGAIKGKQSRRALKIIGITLTCIVVTAILAIIVPDLLNPSLSLNPLNLSFTVSDGLNPPPQTVEIGSSRRAVNWFATADAPWLSFDPLFGSTDKEISTTLSVDIWGMYPGEYAATVTISAANAKNTPLEIPVSLVITDTKETLAIKEAVGGNMDSLEIHYNKQPPYNKGLQTNIVNLTNNNSATDPTWRQLLQFIAADNTGKQIYIPGVYMCGSFAETLHNNA